MRSIKFGKDRFHLNNEMYEWLFERLGPGGWYKDSLNEHLWAWESAFGNTTYYFARDKDASMFLLRWA